MNARGSIVLVGLLFACDDKAAAPSTASTPASEDLGAMTEYLRKSKSAEAQVNLRSIARSVQFASEEERIGPDGTVQRGQLVAAPPTPAVGECCKQPQHKCVPKREDWQHAGWQAIAFEVADPHYYSYELAVDANGFVARAIGDLDCDGVLATFELRGTKRPDGTYEIAAAPTSDQPLE